MTTNLPGWAVQLVGDKIDLDDLRELLKHPFDPWLEKYETDDGSWSLLRSTNWDRLTDAGDVYQDANRMIGLMNGQARLIHTDARPVKPGQVLKFGPHGKREFFLIANTGHLRVNEGTDRARFSVVRSGAPGPPQKSKIQRWLREAESKEVMAELFIHLSRADNWFDFYKSMELAERLRTKERIKGILCPSDWKQWKKVWRTANCHRHAPDPEKYPLPTDPPDLEASLEFVLKAIERIL